MRLAVADTDHSRFILGLVDAAWNKVGKLKSVLLAQYVNIHWIGILFDYPYLLLAMCVKTHHNITMQILISIRFGIPFYTPPEEISYNAIMKPDKYR